MTTPDLILSAIVALGCGLISWQLQKQSRELAEVKLATLKNTVLLEELPISEMKSEIKSNADNIRIHDKQLIRIDGDISFLKQAMASFKAFCAKQHNVDLGNL